MATESNYELQVRLVEEALVALGADSPHKGAEIREWLEKERPEDYQKLEASWGSYLSRAVVDTTNRIERTPGKYTYSLRPVTDTAPPPPPENTPSVDPQPTPGAPRQQRELILYPLLATWLRSRGYSARVTARSKGGGAWGNPDVTGIKVVDGFLGQKSLEVSTIEAKLSSDSWRYYFFEAVAHKRFAHRAYFVFAQGSDEPSLSEVVDGSLLREYGEKYHVGVLVVFVPSDRYAQLISGNVSGTELRLDDVVVEELWPALHDTISAAAQTDFLQGTLKLSEDGDIYRFDEVIG